MLFSKWEIWENTWHSFRQCVYISISIECWYSALENNKKNSNIRMQKVLSFSYLEIIKFSCVFNKSKIYILLKTNLVQLLASIQFYFLLIEHFKHFIRWNKTKITCTLNKCYLVFFDKFGFKYFIKYCSSNLK